VNCNPKAIKQAILQGGSHGVVGSSAAIQRFSTLVWDTDFGFTHAKLNMPKLAIINIFKTSSFLYILLYEELQLKLTYLSPF